MSTPPLNDEEKLLALLNELHRFPTAYDIRVICVTETAEWLADRLLAETGLSFVAPPRHRASGGGKYVSVQMQLQVQVPEDVVRTYRIIRTFEGVKTFF
jgi:putative lipoic acid-binding regulatory protein